MTGRSGGSHRPRLKPLDQPKVVTVRTDAMGDPTHVRLPGKPARRVEAIRERWRIDDEWWREAISREYRAVVLDDGRVLTLYHDLLDGLWYATRADPHITRIQPLRPRGLRCIVHLDRGEPFEVMLEALERSRLGVGDALPKNKRHHLLDADADVRVRDAALNLISYRARTRIELVRRLRQKGFEPVRIGICLDRLQERGLIDDEAVAAAFTRDRLRHKPRGRAALASELRAKGVSGELAQQTIDRVFEDEEVTDGQLAIEVAEKWIARQNGSVLEALASTTHSPERDKARRRLNGYLGRRGFRGAAMREGIEAAVALARG